MDNSERHAMPVQPACDRIRNFDEVALGYTPDLAKAEALRCLDCKNAPCMKGCPVGVHIPDFIRCLKEGRSEDAAKVIYADNNLPAICGRVCPQSDQCEKYCVRTRLGGAVAIGNLERYVADEAAKKGFHRNAVSKKAGKRVAVVGSGPASISCAAELALGGVDVTMFEALQEAGGVLIYGIPEFRLPKSLVKREICEIERLGVQIVPDVIIGKTLYLDELLEHYDAVFMGTGAGLPMFLGCEGEYLCGVYSANEYLTRINLMKAYKPASATPILLGKKVVVVGAGNVAMDSARSALRLGAEVTLVYRRSRAEMPAREEEINHAEEEGVKFELLCNPVKFYGEDGKVKGMQLVRMHLGEPDSSGRRRPIATQGSEFDIACDEVIVALGTTPNPIIRESEPKLQFTERHTVVADEDGRTNIPRLYVGGDAMTGAATVIQAMGAGKRAAKAILGSFGEN